MFPQKILTVVFSVEKFRCKVLMERKLQLSHLFEGQACCRKFGPAGRAAAGASTHPAASTSFGIVSVKACYHSCTAFRAVRGVEDPREVTVVRL